MDKIYKLVQIQIKIYHNIQADIGIYESTGISDFCNLTFRNDISWPNDKEHELNSALHGHRRCLFFVLRRRSLDGLLSK